MAYKTVRISELMAHEFGQVEGGFSLLDESTLKSAIPTGLSFDQFTEQLKQGHLLLLNDSPTLPVLIKERNELGIETWQLNSQSLDNLDPMASQALLSRTKITGGGGGSGQSGNLHPALPMPEYIPEPAKPDYSNPEPVKYEYEYSLEIATSDESLRRSCHCTFNLAKTEDEVALSDWDKTKTQQGTRYTTLVAVDEPKKLHIKLNNRSLAISPKLPVKVKAKGTQVADEGLIPLSPVVQLGERLGFPTQGFYYHFHDGKLVQEYKLKGDKQWYFYATNSVQDRLDNSPRYNSDHNALLVWWKIGGKIVENQYLVYLEQQITQEELNTFDEAWLNEHGVKLDIPALLDAKKLPVIKKDPAAQTSPEVKKQNKPTTHTVQADPQTGQREGWRDIAQQHGLTPKELFELNPQYEADPATLAIGHSLHVSKPTLVTANTEEIYDFPPEPPKIVNQPLNTIYQYSERHLLDTSIKAINSQELVKPDIPLVNLKKLSDTATEFNLAFAQVEFTQPLSQYWASLFTAETDQKTQEIIKKYNAHLNDPVRQGEIVVLPTIEPRNQQQKSRLEALIEDAQAASVELAKLTEAQLATLNRHFELLDFYASNAMKFAKKHVTEDGLPGDLYAYTSAGVGAIASGVEQHLKNINGVLSEINDLYVAQVAMASRVGGMNYGSFVAERAALFKKLDGNFAALSKRSVQIPVFAQIKRNLKLSTRSVIHNADEIIAKGVVPNLGKRMANVAVGIAASRGVGYIGLVIGGASSAKSIYEACAVDGSGECGKTATREVAGFVGGLYGGGAMGKIAVTGTFLVLGIAGVTSTPVLAIASIGAFVVGGAIGGIAGATLGKSVGDFMYFVYEWGTDFVENTLESL